MDWIDDPADIAPEFAVLRELLATSGPWARAALGAAAVDSPWFAAQARALCPPAAPNPALAIAAGMVVALPMSGGIAAQAREFGAAAVRQVLGHDPVDGEMFGFGAGEAVWADSGETVARTQLRTMPPADRREFYASMGLAPPADVLADAPAPSLAAAPATERIKVRRDGREAPVLAEIRQRVAALRQERDLLARGDAPADGALAPDHLQVSDRPAGTDSARMASAGSAGPEAQAAPGAGGATTYDRIWQEVATERAAARARGEAPPPVLAQAGPPSTFQLIWAEIQAERAAGLAPPDLVDLPRVPDHAGFDAGTDLADAPPDRDLIDASAAFLEPSG
ncbi:MAG: hypothetical protein FJZ01_08650 [Candidatus Sericytochromatia bacterium]|nr:hypothetical protein [Candidatus Tanganyikabacteria bacterium]